MSRSTVASPPEGWEYEEAFRLRGPGRRLYEAMAYQERVFWEGDGYSTVGDGNRRGLEDESRLFTRLADAERGIERRMHEWGRSPDDQHHRAGTSTIETYGILESGYFEPWDPEVGEPVWTTDGEVQRSY